MRLSFGDLLDNETPLFVERLREIYGVHTCDKRRSKVGMAYHTASMDVLTMSCILSISHILQNDSQVMISSLDLLRRIHGGIRVSPVVFA